jgi:thiosulfate dehydrogenase
MKRGRLPVVLGVIGLTIGLAAGAVADKPVKPHEEAAQDVVHGAPPEPSEAWLLAAGGRIYDNWWEALDRPEPTSTNPAYPATGKQKGADTWRCKECHGWDYRGRDGVYRKGSHFTGIKGIHGAAGRPLDKITAILRDRHHPYTPEMIRDDELVRVAIFVSRGQVDMRRWIDLETRKVVAGDVERGKAIFQTVCANCHGFDGRLLDWGENGEHAYVGTEAVEVPDEVLNKILNSHPGVQMVNLRAFPVEDAAAVLAYAATLPTE